MTDRFVAKIVGTLSSGFASHFLHLFEVLPSAIIAGEKKAGIQKGLATNISSLVYSKVCVLKLEMSKGAPMLGKIPGDQLH